MKNSQKLRDILSSSAAMITRGLGLFARFSLIIYIAKYLSLEDVGSFGLIVGFTGMLPAFIGWGLNYFLGRSVVDVTKLRARSLIRDRLLVSAVSLTAAIIVVVMVAQLKSIVLPRHTVLIAAIGHTRNIGLRRSHGVYRHKKSSLRKYDFVHSIVVLGIPHYFSWHDLSTVAYIGICTLDVVDWSNILLSYHFVENNARLNEGMDLFTCRF